MENKGFSLNAIELQKYQPNSYPFLMIDYVTEVIPGVSSKGFKNLSNNEWFFPVHYQGEPNMPGALQLEALTQMLTIAITTLPEVKNNKLYGLKYSIKLKKSVLPGDRLDIETEVISWKRGICIGKGIGYVNNKIVCEGDMIISVPDIVRQFVPKK
jgi:3-hydroxyacyl-[acyl-carrier-protein] dehydratase